MIASRSYGTMPGDVSVLKTPKRSRSSTRLLQYRPGYAPMVATIRAQPKDYTLEVIFVIFFCFFPLGLVALYYANKVKACYRNNDYVGSYAASKVVRILLIISLVFGVCIWVLAILEVINLNHNVN